MVLIAAFFAAMSLFYGITSMAHGGSEDQGSSHLLMLRRVGWQALALVFMLLALLSNLE
jgi:hypothetical protein